MLGTTDTLNRVVRRAQRARGGDPRLGLSFVTRQPLLRRALVQRALGLAGDLPAIVTHPAVA